MTDLPADLDLRIQGPGLTWWLEASARLGRIPSRSDFGPEDLTARALPHVILAEIAPNAETARYRLVGTNHVAFTLWDFTGVTLEELYPKGSPLLGYMKGLYRALYERKRPIWSVNQATHPRLGTTVLMRRLMLPLSADGVVVNMSLAIQTIEVDPFPEDSPIETWHQSRLINELERRYL